jgi:hypothetical protein
MEKLLNEHVWLKLELQQLGMRGSIYDFENLDVAKRRERK